MDGHAGDVFGVFLDAIPAQPSYSFVLSARRLKPSGSCKSFQKASWLLQPLAPSVSSGLECAPCTHAPSENGAAVHTPFLSKHERAAEEVVGDVVWAMPRILAADDP
jgi:hypothetical protein